MLGGGFRLVIAFRGVRLVIGFRIVSTSGDRVPGHVGEVPDHVCRPVVMTGFRIMYVSGDRVPDYVD